MNILNILVEEEADRKRREDLSYTEKTKGAGANKIVDRVIVALKGVEGGVWTRHLRMWNKLDQAIGRMEKKKSDLAVKFKADAQLMFAAEDIVLTRVLEVAEFSVLLKKQTVTDDKFKVEHELILKELTETMPELEAKIKELTEKYTTVTKGSAPAQPAMTISRDKLAEGLIGDALRAFKQMVMEFIKPLKLWGKSFDKKLKTLRVRAEKLG